MRMRKSTCLIGKTTASPGKPPSARHQRSWLWRGSVSALTPSPLPGALAPWPPPGLMLGAPDPMEGFPAGIRFSLFGFARNAGTAPLTLHGLINYMGKAGPRSVALPDVALAPGEALDLTLDKVAQLLSGTEWRIFRTLPMRPVGRCC